MAHEGHWTFYVWIGEQRGRLPFGDVLLQSLSPHFSHYSRRNHYARRRLRWPPPAPSPDPSVLGGNVTKVDRFGVGA